MNEQDLKMITELRHTLHRHPGLSLHERETKEYLMRFVAEHTSLEVTNRGNWFYAVKRASSVPAKPPVAFRADFDALPIDETLALPYASRCPGISHKCGHDGHAAVLAGFAVEISRVDVPRDVCLIFQHAEEIGAGAAECAPLIDELHIGEIYAFHNLNGYPEGTVVYRRSLTQPASMGLTIRFAGRASHASAPEEGANPSFAIADLIGYVREMSAAPHDGMALATIVNIEAGRKDFGVSAGSGEISITLRAEQEGEMNRMEKDLREEAEKLAARDHLAADFAVSDYFPETRNDGKCLDRVVRAAARSGIPAMEMPELWRASEDFGWYLKKCPGAIFYIGDGERYPALHTAEYDFNDRIIPTAVRMFLALLDDPS